MRRPVLVLSHGHMQMQHSLCLTLARRKSLLLLFKTRKIWKNDRFRMQTQGFLVSIMTQHSTQVSGTQRRQVNANLTMVTSWGRLWRYANDLHVRPYLRRQRLSLFSVGSKLLNPSLSVNVLVNGWSLCSHHSCYHRPISIFSKMELIASSQHWQTPCM